jgi:hypothetical protein
MKLGLTDDVTLGRKVDEFQQRRPPERVWGSVRDLLIRIAVTVSRYDRTPSCSGSGTDLQQSLSGALTGCSSTSSACSRRAAGGGPGRAARSTSGPTLTGPCPHWPTPASTTRRCTGGRTWSRPPDEQYRRFGRWLIEEGVDLIHGHSAHVFQGIERHDGGTILYDCGDFVDDYAVDRDLRNDRGFLFELDVTGAGEVGAVTLHPVETERCAVHGAEGRVAAWCRETMRERSEPFGTAGEYERAGEALRLAL